MHLNNILQQKNYGGTEEGEVTAILIVPDFTK
jgi:hypothetical protein